MLPSPSRLAVILFIASGVSLIAGVAFSSAAAVSLGGSILVVMAAVLANTLSLGRRMRRERLEFAWWLDHGTGSAGGSAVPGVPFDVRCYVRHHGALSIDVHRMDPLVPETVTLSDSASQSMRLHGRSRNEFTIRLSAPSVGRLVLHGLSMVVRGPFGLFLTPLYFPNPLVIRLLPRAAAGRHRGRRALPQASAAARSGKTMVRRRGGGTELHELRELVAGDPFKSIAWKASARRGKLMVKEVEQEVQETRWTLLDISGSMRGGPLGRRKLDFAIEVAAAEARGALEGGDRVGLVTFDGRVVDHLPPSEGKTQMLQVYNTLLATTEVVDEDRTDISDDDLARQVARYVRLQDGIDFLDRQGEVDMPSLLGHIGRGMGAKVREVRGTTDASRTLRAYCRDRALPVPYLGDPGSGAKARALAEALTLAGGRSRVPTSIVVVTDFDGVVDGDAVLRALKLVRSHGHRVSFILPDGRSFAAEPEGRLERSLATVYGRSEDRRLRASRQLLRRIGVPAIIATHGDGPGWVAARVRGAA